MAGQEENGAGSPISEDWIELHPVAPSLGAGNIHRDTHGRIAEDAEDALFARESNGSPPPRITVRGPVPNLRLDTSQLEPESARDDDPVPESAILDLAKGRTNLAINNWLPEESAASKNRSSPVSPSKSTSTPRRPSSNSARSDHSSLMSSLSRSPRRSRKNSQSQGGRRDSEAHSTIVSPGLSPGMSPRLSPQLSPKPNPVMRTLSVQNLEPEDIHDEHVHAAENNMYNPTAAIPQLTLTVERSFQHKDDESQISLNDHSSIPDENVFDDIYEESFKSGDEHSENETPGLHSNKSVTYLNPFRKTKSSRRRSSERSDASPDSAALRRKRTAAAGTSPSKEFPSPSKPSPARLPPHNLALSGAAYSAQKSFIDAEEEGGHIDDDVGSAVPSETAGTGSVFDSDSTIGSAEYYDMDDELDEDMDDDEHIMRPRGRSLFYFYEDNVFRNWVFRIISSKLARYLDIILTIVQVIVLCVEEWSPFKTSKGLPSVINRHLQWVYTALYAIYTLFAVAKSIAFGVVTNEELTLREAIRQISWILRKILHFITLGSIKDTKSRHMSSVPYSAQNCFLRKSWGRVDFISIVFFWTMTGVSTNSQIDSLDLIIAGLSHLRILRLLDEISATRVVLHVMKTAIPFLQNVLIFIGFFLAIWGVIGLQSFNGSLRRVCIYEDNITSQNCGSWLHPETREVMPYLFLNSARGTFRNQTTSKGYTCPVGSKCVELRAFPPYGSLSSMANQSFDNIFNALEIVFIMMSNNGFTPIMYNVIDAEYLGSSLFFISGVLILGIWLMNLLVAVMVSSYSSVRYRFEDALGDTVLVEMSWKLWNATLGRIFSPSKGKAAVASPLADGEVSGSALDDADTEQQQTQTFREKRDHGSWILNNTVWGKRYTIIYPVFAVLAVIDLIIQASRTAPNDGLFGWELSMAIIFGIEILMRFWVFLPYWRYFFFSLNNLMDLVLAVANCVILAFYNDDELYAWLTAFQLLRVYRMIGALKYSRIFWLQVFGNFKALASLTAFFFMCTFFCTLIAAKMLRGQFPMESDGEINSESFYDLAVSFFSMYQIASTENWTDVLFWVIDNVSRPGDNVVGLACMGILFCGWLFFANFLIFNLFVGIMSESLHGAIANKREEQVRQFFDEVKQRNLGQGGPLFKNFLQGFAYRPGDDEDALIVAARPVKFREKIMAIFLRWFSHGEDSLVSRPLRSAIERQFIIEFLETHDNLDQFTGGKVSAGKTFLSLSFDSTNVYSFDGYAKFPFVVKCRKALYRFFNWFRHYPQDYREYLFERLEKQEEQAGNPSHKAYVEGMFDHNANMMAILDDYCKDHPKFDCSLFLFSSDSKVRRFCQKLVPPSNGGARLSKIYPNKWVAFWVRTLYLGATLSLVIQTCINTPLVANDQSTETHTVWTYFRVLDLVYGIIFTIEFQVKVIADGFHFTPNAYTWSIWNLLDFIVLISIWMTFINDIVNGVLSRYLRALLALRALRLMSFFHGSDLLLGSVFKYGLRNILGACLITLSIVIPYAVWGKNIFHDRLKSCNDGSVDYLSDCSGEYVSTVFENFEILAPRITTENYFNYNNFWEALLIQFGVLSLEGWVDVLEAVTSIAGKNKQPSTYSSTGNAVYPILYHYIGAVLIMTMLIAVIIRNYALTMGTAFLTEQQLSWLDVKNTLKLIKPTPRPPQYKSGSLRQKLLTLMPTWITSIEVWTLFVATVDMAAYFYPLGYGTRKIYGLILIACSLLLTLLSILRLMVMKPTLYFHNWWNIFGFVVCLVVTILTICDIVIPGGRAPGTSAASRVADIAMLLLWIPRTKKLYQFYVISTAALGEISMLLGAWFTLFITYAIAFNQSFGLTKFGTQSTWSRNFRTIPKALIALFTMSCGEGWNQFLIDFTISKPYCIETSEKSECGIPGFAYFLFITWNVLSMYVFANLFISLVCEACWYVYRSGPVNISERDIVNLLDSWQQFDPKGTGFIRSVDLYKFLGRAQGYFSISIYSHDPKYNVHQIIAATQSDARNVKDPYNVDMDAIYDYLADMPVQKYRGRRSLYELFTAQAQLMSHSLPGGKGMKFSVLTLMFPLYKDMNPAETLTLKEFIELKVHLHEAQMTLAANFVIRRWRLKQQQRASSERPEYPGVGYDQSWTHSKPGKSVYWVS